MGKLNWNKAKKRKPWTYIAAKPGGNEIESAKRAGFISELVVFYARYKGGNNFLDSIRQQALVRGFDELSTKQLSVAVNVSRKWFPRASKELDNTYRQMFQPSP